MSAAKPVGLFLLAGWWFFIECSIIRWHAVLFSWASVLCGERISTSALLSKTGRKDGRIEKRPVLIRMDSWRRVWKQLRRFGQDQKLNTFSPLDDHENEKE